MKMWYDIDKEEAIKQLRPFNSIIAKYLHSAVTESFDIIGQTSVGRFMVHTKFDFKTGKLVGLKKDSPKIHIRTGRLARSVYNKFSFAQGAEGEREGYRNVMISGNKIIGQMGSFVPYARIHEYGGKIRHPSGKIITIPRRPYLVPAMNLSKSQIEDLFRERVFKALKKYE